MPEGGEPTAWDFLTLLKAWNLYALPALLFTAGLVVVLRNRRFERKNAAGVGLDGRRLVKIAAFIHLGISVQAVVRLTQELLTMREMGVPESIPNLIGQTISVIVNPLLALGFWRASRFARWPAILWYALLAVIGVIVTYWRWNFHAAIDLTWWADYFAGKLMPLFLLVVMFLPRVRRAFSRPKVSPVPDLELIAKEPIPAPVGRWSIISLVAVLCLIVVYSNVVVDSADWIERSLNSSSDQAGPE